MLKAIASVRDQVVRECRNGQIDLATISRIFTAVTVVDHIVYVCYDTPADNPIWGEFCRWTRRPSVYDSMETIVEVRYAAHLSEDWRRFVVCKELCHALDTAEGCHVATAGAIDNIVNAFSLKSAAQAPDHTVPAFQAEIIAEAGAIELLFPLPVRKERLAAGEPLDAAALAGEFNLPAVYAEMAIDAQYIQAIEWLFANG
jgi:hypothetical protein